MITIESIRVEFLVFLPAGITLILNLPTMRDRLKREFDDKIQKGMRVGKYFEFKFLDLLTKGFWIVATLWLLGGLLALFPPLIPKTEVLSYLVLLLSAGFTPLIALAGFIHSMRETFKLKILPITLSS